MDYDLSYWGVEGVVEKGECDMALPLFPFRLPSEMKTGNSLSRWPQ